MVSSPGPSELPQSHGEYSWHTYGARSFFPGLGIYCAGGDRVGAVETSQNVVTYPFNEIIPDSQTTREALKGASRS